MKTTWLPTQESLEKLLAWLKSDREEAAEQYERVRLRLTKYFICNGCGDDAEHLADVSIDRVMKNLELGKIPEPFTGNKALYFLAFAKRIRQEHYEDQKRRQIPDQVIDRDEAEDEDACLNECVRILGEEDRWLAIEYYRFEKTTKIGHHKNLAERFSLTLPGLRTRIHRIRERLRPCIEECLERRSSETPERRKAYLLEGLL